jgi:hypothetical protein
MSVQHCVKRRGCPADRATTGLVRFNASFDVGRCTASGRVLTRKSVDHQALGWVVPIGRGEQAPQGRDGPASAPLNALRRLDATRLDRIICYLWRHSPDVGNKGSAVAPAGPWESPDARWPRPASRESAVAPVSRPAAAVRLCFPAFRSRTSNTGVQLRNATQ